jgi:hypothetical protein
VLTQTLLGFLVVLVSVSLSTVITFALCIACTPRVLDQVKLEEPADPWPAWNATGPLAQPRVLHCSSCRGYARRGAFAPSLCMWCDRCEADSLREVVLAHASTELEVVMANRFCTGRNGIPNLQALKKLISVCYRVGLGA